MKRIRLLLTISLIAGIVFSFLNIQPTKASDNHVNIYMFWGEGCPHCAKAKPFLQSLDAASDKVSAYGFEVYYSEKNQNLLQAVIKELDINSSGVPLIIVGNEPFIGYSESSNEPIQQKVKECLESSCPDSVADIVGINKVSTPEDKKTSTKVSVSKKIDIPFLGQIDTKDFSLPILTIIIAALDGFNPCAMWTLVFLISVLLGMENRKRMWALGSAFIIASAFVYFMFLSAWLNIFLFIGYVSWIKILIGLFALGTGCYYLYDSYKNKNGACKVEKSEKKREIFNKIKDITHRKSFWIALGGIILLAFAVNLVELVCSAGLPAIYTGILSASNLSSSQYYFYLLFYIFIFMLDDLLIFFIAMFTMKITGIQAKYTKYAHIVGGILMIIIGLLLIFAPQLLMFG